MHAWNLLLLLCLCWPYTRPDYAAEQADELEALESIFPDELEGRCGLADCSGGAGVRPKLAGAPTVSLHMRHARDPARRANRQRDNCASRADSAHRALSFS